VAALIQDAAQDGATRQDGITAQLLVGFGRWLGGDVPVLLARRFHPEEYSIDKKIGKFIRLTGVLKTAIM
jgi:hypothetical protein